MPGGRKFMLAAHTGRDCHVRAAQIASTPDALVAFMAKLPHEIAAIGLGARPLSHRLHKGLAEAGLEAALKAMPIKTDRRDAEGNARLLQMGRFRPVHASRCRQSRCGARNWPSPPHSTISPVSAWSVRYGARASVYRLVPAWDGSSRSAPRPLSMQAPAPAVSYACSSRLRASMTRGCVAMAHPPSSASACSWGRRTRACTRDSRTGA